MNKLERFIYDSVKSKPWLKLLIRNIYQGVFDLLPRKKEFAKNPILFREGFFYGFHDTIPFSQDNRKVLSNKLSIDLKMPTKNDFIDVGYFNFDDTNFGEFGEFVKLGQTNAWNYHKGCRSQWIGNNRFIYNCTKSDKMISKIVDINTREEKEISFPIDSVSSDGRYASSFSYERLEKYMPGYGYCHQDDISFLSQAAPEKTGLYLIDIEFNTSRLIVTLEQLARLSEQEENSKEGFHYVTHSLFSPDGRYLSFFHRWVGDDTRKRYTRLVIYNLETNTFEVAPTGYMVSHYVWNRKNQIIAYCNLDGVDSHAILNIPDFSRSFPVAYPRLNSDGHQSFIDDTSFITDTYPDKYRMAKLYKVDIAFDTVELLASVYSPGKFQTKVPHKHIACDLHPCVSRDGRFVCFDTVKSGVRSLAIMSLT